MKRKQSSSIERQKSPFRDDPTKMQLQTTDCGMILFAALLNPHPVFGTPHFLAGYFTRVQIFVFPIKETPMKPRTFNRSGFSSVNLHL